MIKSNKINQKVFFVYSLIFVGVLITYHFAIKIYGGDDINIFSSALNNINLLDFLQIRYNTWSSRTVIEALCVLFVKNIFFWKITNIAIFCLLAYSLYELSHKSSLYGVYILLLLYPLTEMASAGWIATMMNYLWPLSFGFYSLIIINRLSNKLNVYWYEIFLSYLALMIGISNEQYCVVHLAMLIIYSILFILNKCSHKYLWIYAGHYIITIANLIYILICPGNHRRNAEEVSNWMKDFYEKSIFDKLIDGFESTISTLLSSSNILFLIFSIFICICIWKKSKTQIIRIIGGIPMTITLFISLGNINSNGYFSSAVSLIKNNSGVTAENWMKFSNYIPIVLYVCIMGCIIISFFFIFDNFIQCLECSFFFILAIASRVILGFSPTLFASNHRTFLFCYGLLILIMLKMYASICSIFSKKELQSGKYAITFLTIMIILNNIVSASNT